MKIRSDFVTNSSSSSYVIAYKDSPDFDEETLQRYPVLKNFGAILESIMLTANDYGDTTEGECVKTVKELDEHFVGCYKYGDINTLEKILDDDDHLKEQYGKCIKLLDDGYRIVFKSVDYNDTVFDAILRNLSKSDGIVQIIEEE